MDNKNRSHKYKILIQWDEDAQDFRAVAPELGNCAVRAKTQNEAIELVNDAIEQHLRALEKENLPVPIPSSQKTFSGKILIRIDPKLHRDIATEASMAGLSISHFVEKIILRRKRDIGSDTKISHPI